MALNHFYFLILFIHSSQRDGSMEVFLPSSGKQSTHTRWQWKCYEQDANQHPELKQTRGSKQIPKKKKTQGKVHIFFSSPTPPCHHHVLRIFFFLPCSIRSGVHDLAVVLRRQDQLRVCRRRRRLLDRAVDGVRPAERLQRQVRRLLAGDHHGSERRALQQRIRSIPRTGERLW